MMFFQYLNWFSYVIYNPNALNFMKSLDVFFFNLFKTNFNVNILQNVIEGASSDFIEYKFDVQKKKKIPHW